MKKTITTISLIGLLFTANAGEKGEKTYAIKKDISKIEWKASKVTGQHEGIIGIKEGTLILENNQLKSGSIVIDMNSIEVTNIEDENTNDKLLGHLKSDDFFSVAKFPSSSLEIEKVVLVEEDNYTISGVINIKGIKKKVEFPATILVEKGKLVAVGELKIDRTEFQVKYGSGKFFENLGDRMISDEFLIKFKIGAKP